MTGPRIEFNEEAIAELQRDINAKAQDCIRQVNADMAGHPVNEVMEALRTRLTTIGVEPDDEGLKPYAQDISDRTLRE